MNNGLSYRICRAVGLACIVSMAMVTGLFAQSAKSTAPKAASTNQNASIEKAFKRELKLVEGLKVYNSQLVDQIKAQDQAKRDIAKSITDSKKLEPQLVPLMKEMLAALGKFVKADLPFHRADRLNSIVQLESLMLDADASTSDRFRNIMDIYTVEMEYGNTYEAYADTQVTGGGEEIEVDMLRVGRLGLYYQTKDGKSSGMWDRNANAWVPLSDDMNRHLRKAIKVAAKQIAPELMNLPILAPEGA